MNDLELIRQFRDEVPEPDARARRAAFAAMFEAEHSTQRQPRAAFPARRRWPAVAAAMSAAVILALAVPVLLPSGHRGSAPAASATQVLLRAAQVAARQEQGGSPGPGQYVYTKSDNAYMNYWAEGFSVLMPQVREIWIGTDGSGRILETNGTPTFLSDQDHAAWESSGSPDLGGEKTSDETFEPSGPPAPSPGSTAEAGGGLYYQDLSTLPTDPAELRAKIESREIESGPPGDAETFTIIGDLLRETYAPPALRAALYQAAAGLSGVELVGETKDPEGRDGVGVAYTSAGIRHELIFDPNTSALLGEQDVVVDPAPTGLHVDAGTVVGWAAYLSSGIVDSTSDRP
jgi:hypothetical protein